MLCEFVASNQSTLVCVQCGASVRRRDGKVFRSCKLKLQKGSAGTHLKALLQLLGFDIAPGCKCNGRALHMNAMGNDWCEENIDTIVGWLAEEAASRGLPFLNAVGRLLVKRAILNARKATPH